ncbi:MAG: response regulator [Candidatus Eisenbacteria sp.]|nr:response regulator [Candidatus Eisenbacteria bacterium]
MVARRQRILWVDDEIDMLRPHMLYLEGKGYQVTPVANGHDALELVDQETFDLVLLDEMMPGMGGLTVLAAIKERQPNLPVVMITKSEEENLMDQALGRKISDYLIKPVNPSQIFLACKKIFEARDLERGTAVREYVRELDRGRLGLSGRLGWSDWVRAYLRAARWELELDALGEGELREAHHAQLVTLNRQFGRFVADGYADWVAGPGGERPPLSPEIVAARVVPPLAEGKRVALIVIDCLRMDQWLVFEPLLAGEFRIQTEAACAILPTATPYARNAIFSGLFPAEIAARYPQFWQEVQEHETGLNRFERELLVKLLERQGVGAKRVQYAKVVSRQDAEDFRRRVGSYADSDLVALVFTFVDTFTHGRSRDAIVAEFAQDASGLRAHLGTWFERSIVRDAIREMGRQGRRVIVTTDHGNIQVRRPARVRADRRASSGTRFKFGPALRGDSEQALVLETPEHFGLPGGGLMKTYLFAREDFFFVYPTQQHTYERILRDSFQHGGISLEEMIVPLATLDPA